ncbi:MAG: CoA transferase [Chloroflexi bacterium]|nr:MAG: CoA transferase [Chloroflexota bacterium]
MPEKREVEINSRADTLDLMSPEVRPWPVTPPPSREEVMKVYATRKAEEFGQWLEDNLRFEDSFGKPEALQGFKVLDIGLWRLGHKFVASLLGEAGAEVICIEPPEGDPLRKLTPFGREEYMLTHKETGEKCGLEFINEMRNQYSVTLNVDTEEGQEIFRNLARHADVLIDGMLPGYMDERGIGYRQLSQINPKLVYCWVGVRGQWGPFKDRVSKHGQWELDPFGQAADAFIHSTGFPQDQLPRGKGGDPTRSGVWISDYVAGEQAGVNILAALYWRDEFSGEGQFIEVTGAEALMDILDFDITWYGFNGSIKARTGGWDPNLNQYEWNPCKDGYMMIGGQSDRLWYRIGMCIERDFPQFGRLIHEDPWLKEMGARNALHALVKTYTLTTRWLRDINRVEAEEKLLEYEVAAGPVLFVDEVCEFHHFKYRPWVYPIETDYGTILYATSPTAYQMRTPHRVKWMGRALGQDNYEIYSRWLGMGPTQVDELKGKGVI